MSFKALAAGEGTPSQILHSFQDDTADRQRPLRQTDQDILPPAAVAAKTGSGAPPGQRASAPPSW